MRRVLTILAMGVLAAGCGNDKTRPEDLARIGPPGSFRDARFAKHGIFLRAPARWREIAGRPPQIVTLATGSGQIVVWRYPRTEPLPRSRGELATARDELVRAIKTRDSSFDVKSTRIVIKRGLRGVEVVGTATNQGTKRGVRSLHAYGHGAEVIVDEFAPTQFFARVDKETFGPVARSLKLRKPRR